MSTPDAAQTPPLSRNPDEPAVAAVTVNWNGFTDTVECIESLLAQTYPLNAIVVVDNASDGDDAGRLEERYGSSISVIRNHRNLGCGGGYNTGIHHALARLSPDYLLAVNNDVVAQPDMVAHMVRAARADAAIGLVGPKIYYHNWQGRRDVIWSAGGAVHRWGLKLHTQRGDGAADVGQYDAPRRVDWVSGAAVLATPAAFRDAGHFSTWYFIGHEDIELCLKAASAGHRIVYEPRAVAWHKVGASAKMVGITYADPAAYFHLIREAFPLYVYLYHVALFPLLLARWATLYLLKSRDPAQLRRFLSDLRRFLSPGGHA